MTRSNDSPSTVHDRLNAAPSEEAAARPRPGSFDSPEERATFWREQFEQERERLAKLWVAYQDLKAELEDRERQTETIAAGKAGEQLADEAAEGSADAPESDEATSAADDDPAEADGSEDPQDG